MMPASHSRQNRNLEFKILLSGDEGAGKTSLIRRFIENKFDELIDPNLIEGSYISTELNLFGAPIKLQLQDIGKAIWEETSTYFIEDNDGFLIVFDTSIKMKVKPYLEYFLKPILEFNRDTPFLIIGNKSDLPVKVNINKISQFISKLGGNFVQTSAKTGDNVSYIFKLITSEIVKKKAAAKKRTEDKRTDGLDPIFSRYQL